MGFPRLNLPSVSERLGNVTDRLRGIMPQGLSGRIGFPHGLSAAGGLTLPYKVAVVAVMVLVAGGTLVTFGSAGAETATVGGSTMTSAGGALPGTSEVAPRVEGQAVFGSTNTPGTSILSADDLLANLQLTDYSPKSDNEKSDDDKKSDDDNKKKDDKKSSTSTPAAASTASPASTTSGASGGSSSGAAGSTPSSSGGGTPSSEPTKAPAPQPTKEPDPVEGGSHKNWVQCTKSVIKGLEGLCGSEPGFTS